MTEKRFADNVALEPIAARLAEAWDVYWAVWSVPWDQVADRFPGLGEEAITFTRLVVQAFDACDEEADDTLNAIGQLMLLTDDLLLASFSEVATLAPPSRLVAEPFVLRTGVADWCLRLGAPLHDEEGAHHVRRRAVARAASARRRA
jgi:hypothetical protein